MLASPVSLGSILIDLCRRAVTERRVDSCPVVEDFDVLMDSRTRVVEPAPVLIVRVLLLEASKEALHDGVVPAIPLSAHAAFDAVLLEELSEALARVLRSTIGMVHQVLPGSPEGQGILERLLYQVRVHARRYGPAHDHARGEVDDRSKVNPAGARRHIRNVSAPSRVLAFRLKLSIEAILGYGEFVPGIGRDAKA